MSQDARIKVRSTHRYNASPEMVYDTLMDAAKAKKFMFATLAGKMIKAEIDGKVGGYFTFIDRRPEGDAAHYGKYVRLDRPKQIAFDFSVQKDAKESDLVEIDIVPLKQGCEVTLTHHMKKEYEHLEDRVQDGWDGILDGLGTALRAKGK